MDNSSAVVLTLETREMSANSTSGPSLLLREEKGTALVLTQAKFKESWILIHRYHHMAVEDDSGVEPKRWCGVTFEDRPVLVQAHMVSLFYKSPHYLIRAQRKGFELLYIVLNESTWEGICATFIY